MSKTIFVVSMNKILISVKSNSIVCCYWNLGKGQDSLYEKIKWEIDDQSGR